MSRNKWHIEQDGACTTVARSLPAQFDVCATARFPLVGKTRLAQQIRQDMWRALQRVRGFSPVVKVERIESTLLVTAGGRVSGPLPRGLSDRIEALLQDAQARHRWIQCAGRRQG